MRFFYVKNLVHCYGGLDGGQLAAPSACVIGRPTLSSSPPLIGLFGGESPTFTQESIMTTSLVRLENGQAITTSLQVAEYFDKQHKNILRDIDTLIAQLDKSFATLNFELCFKNNELQNGKPQAYYNLTRDAFTLLAMGFTGAKALQFKLAFLNAFNQLEHQVIHQQTTLVHLNTKLKDKLMSQHLRYRQMYRYLQKELSQEEIARCMQISTRMVRMLYREMQEFELLPEQEVFVLAHTGRISRMATQSQLGLEM